MCLCLLPHPVFFPGLDALSTEASDLEGRHIVLLPNLGVPRALTALEGFLLRFNCVSMSGPLVTNNWLCISLTFLEVGR